MRSSLVTCAAIAPSKSMLRDTYHQRLRSLYVSNLRSRQLRPDASWPEKRTWHDDPGFLLSLLRSVRRASVELQPFKGLLQVMRSARVSIGGGWLIFHLDRAAGAGCVLRQRESPFFRIVPLGCSYDAYCWESLVNGSQSLWRHQIGEEDDMTF